MNQHLLTYLDSYLLTFHFNSPGLLPRTTGLLGYCGLFLWSNYLYLAL